MFVKIMTNPVTSDKDGVKFKPELMEKENCIIVSSKIK